MAVAVAAIPQRVCCPQRTLHCRSRLTLQTPAPALSLFSAALQLKKAEARGPSCCLFTCSPKLDEVTLTSALPAALPPVPWELLTVGLAAKHATFEALTRAQRLHRVDTPGLSASVSSLCLSFHSL